jgi:hypothetical protein
MGSPRIINNPDIQNEMTAPDSFMGKVGKVGEQVAEFAVPAGVVGKATKGASLAARALAQAGTAAAVSGTQTGGDPKSMAVSAAMGAGGEAAAAALGSTKAAQVLRNSAEKQYGKAINATKEGNKWVSQNVAVPELLDRGVSAMTLNGLKSQATNEAQAVGTAIGKAWDALPQGTSLELQPVWDALDKGASDSLTIQASSGAKIPVTKAAATALDNMDHLKQTLLDVAETNPATGKLEVPVDKLRQLRQAWDDIAAQAKVYQGKDLADAASGKIHAMAADAIRDELGQQFPDIAKLNKEYSFWKNVEKVVGDTVLRREGQGKPLTQTLMGVAGTAMGAPGGPLAAIAGKEGMEGLAALTRSTAWKTVSAVQKANLAKYLVSGNKGAVNFTIQQMLKGIGQEAVSPSQPTATMQLAPALQ